MSKSAREIKIVVLGATNTGRRALIRKYVDSTFTERPDSVDDKPAHKQVTVNGETYLLELLYADLKSQKKIELGDAFILLYAINDRGSFIGTRDLNQVLQQTRAKSAARNQISGFSSPSLPSSSSTPIYLVGSKIDLEDERQVSLEEAKNLAIELRCRKLFEISSKTHAGEIDDLFTKLVLEVPRSQQPQKQSQPMSQPESQPQSAYQQQQQHRQQHQQQQLATAAQSRPSPKQRSQSQPLTSLLTQDSPSRPGTMSSQTPGSTTSPTVSPRKSSVLDRFKFGSLRRTPSMNSLARKKSDSFGETMRRLNSPSASRDNLRLYSNSNNTATATTTTQGGANGTVSANAAKSSPYRLDLDTSSWGSIQWPTDIIPEEEGKMK